MKPVLVRPLGALALSLFAFVRRFYNDDDERIGRIEDMTVAPDGTLSVAIVDVGGFLGIAARRVVVLVDQFSEVAPLRIVLPGATKKVLKQLPEFKYAKEERQASSGAG